MNDDTNQCGCSTQKSIGNKSMRRTSKSPLHRIARPNSMALAVSLALMALTPQLSQAGPGRVCLDGISPVTACAPGVIGTYYANSPALKKFVDTLPGLTAGHANKFSASGKPGEYIPIAVADTTTYPGSEYFIIGVVEHDQWMHSELQKATTQRDYVQLYPKLSERPAALGTSNPPIKAVDSLTGQVLGAPVALTYPNGTPITWPGTKTAANPQGEQVYGYDNPHYLGPIILTMTGTPVRTKMVNFLPTERATLDSNGKVIARNGDMFLPADDLLTGHGATPTGDRYPENRVSFHLHGGDSPWISDGTPHQWVTAAGDSSPYKTGDRLTNVPDMPAPGDGGETLFWPNDQSSRLMWYHDHTFGLTRQNAYGGIAAGYVIMDAAEMALLNGGTLNGVTVNKAIPGALLDQLVLIVQDKSFVPNDIATQDSKWDTNAWGKPGDLWYPHVYEPNQLWAKGSVSGASGLTTALNPAGRWDYAVDLVGNYLPPKLPLHTDPDFGDVAFQDGTYGNVSPTPESYMDTPVINGVAYPVLKVDPKAYRARFLNGANDRYWNLSLWVADGKTRSSDGRTNTEVTTVPADGASYKLADGSTVTVPNDNRPGGVPDPRTAGPNVIQFANEAGFLPAPVIHTPTPMGLDPLTQLETAGGFYLGGAERADTVIDFSQYAGKTLIMYNDSTAPVPGGDPRYDYYTGNPDQTLQGGAPSTPAGFGPNTRTVMQIVVAPLAAGAAAPVAYDPKSTGGAMATELPKVYAATANAHIMTPGTLPTVDTVANTITLPGANAHIALKVKTIEGFTEANFGRLVAQIGTELPGAIANAATALSYVDAPTDIISAGETQYWLIKNNDMDNHPMHFHLFNVQVIARIDQFTKAVKAPEPDEAGWKETVKNWPGEDVVVAMQPKTPQLPFGLPNSVRLMDPTVPPGATASVAFNYLGTPPNLFTQNDLTTGLPANVTNAVVDYGWEYVWHCHILGHEENDLMRPMVFHPVVTKSIAAPTGVKVSAAGVVSWTDPTPAAAAATKGDTSNEIGFRVERAEGKNGVFGAFMAVPPNGPVSVSAIHTTATPNVASVINTLANATSLVDSPKPFTDYQYRVVTVNQAGETPSATVKLSQPPAAPVGLKAAALAPSATSTLSATSLAKGAGTSSNWSVQLGWTDAATNETNYVVQRASGTISSQTGAVTWGSFANKPSTSSLLAPKLTSFTDSSGVSANTLYQYQVHAVNGSLAGPVASVIVATATTLPTPTQLQSGGASGTTSASLQWQNVSSSLATGYEVEHCLGTATTCAATTAVWQPLPGTIVAGTTNTSKFTTNGLMTRSTYQFRVRTVNTVVPPVATSVNGPTGLVSVLEPGLTSPWSAPFQIKTR